VEWNRDITDDGIHLLCASPNSRCQHLTTLKLSGTRVTVRGLLIAISRLPHLVKLKHVELDSAVTQFLAQNNIHHLKLKYLCVTSNTNTSLLCNVMPDINILILDGGPDICPFLNLDNVTKLSFFNSTLSNKEFSSIIEHFSTKLTVLEIVCCDFATDVSLVGVCCLKLEQFKINSKLDLTPKFKLNYLEHFSHLRCVEMSGYETLYIPEIAFDVLLGSYFLKQIVFDFLWFPEGIFDTLIETARKDENIFSNLESIKFQSCQYIALSDLTKIFGLAPKLKKILGLHEQQLPFNYLYCSC
jgi:hypothetical protein